jgi:flavin-binding protein dodecin
MTYAVATAPPCRPVAPTTNTVPRFLRSSIIRILLSYLLALAEASTLPDSWSDSCGSNHLVATPSPPPRLRTRPQDVLRHPTIARVIELSATSEESFEDAINQGVEWATSTLRNVESAWIKDKNVLIKNNEVAGYKVNMAITFVLEEGERPS